VPLLRHLRLALLGAVSGVLAGLASYALLEALDRITRTRLHHPWLVWLLPAAGVVIGTVHQRWGGRAVRGNDLLVDEIHEPSAWVPRRMAPLVFAGTLVSHLFGASVGREGTALQMSGSLTDLVARHLHLPPEDRRLLLIASLAAGFGSVFGVPWAGAVFAIEVQSIGRVRYRAVVPSLAAAFVGDAVVRALGYHHAAMAHLHLPVSGVLLVKVAVAGVAFGLVARAFLGLAHALQARNARHLPWLPARLFVGGLANIALVAVVGRAYIGLSLPLIAHTLAGHDPGGSAFALKLVFTVLALGFGFPGGEVTPLFVIGATLGGALGGPLHVGVRPLGSLGFVAVFAGAANVPLAGTVMAAELFGPRAALAAAVACGVAYLCSSHHGLYARRPAHP
jgi:H+/Cl- antiporter ClcA